MQLTKGGRSDCCKTKNRCPQQLVLLLQAFNYRHDAGADLWDFYLEIDKLYGQRRRSATSAGRPVYCLRFFVTPGFRHRVTWFCSHETIATNVAARLFLTNEPLMRENKNPAVVSGGLNFVRNTCFVWTQKGVEFAALALQENASAFGQKVTSLHAKDHSGLQHLAA